MTPEPSKVLSALEQSESAAFERLFDILKIPSISANPQFAADCVSAANWYCAILTDMGFDARVRKTPGQPAVIAHRRLSESSKPHVLYYGHYDVQPADPLGLWRPPPFEPNFQDGARGKRIVGRGAADDKGQTMMWLEALRAWLGVWGNLPAHTTVVIEGEEETGSPNFDYLLNTYRSDLQADFAVISDGNMWDIETPAIVTQLRGLVYTEVSISTANQDLHSGLYGGSANNAANVLCNILGDLHDDIGHIRLPGIYDDVLDTSPAVRQSWASLSFDEGDFLRRSGLSCPAGERDRPALERLWSRPTADVHGIWAGYSDPGVKTVIPAAAHAKVSFRLVPRQDPQKVVKGFETFVQSRLPPDASMKIEVLEAAPSVEIPTDNIWLEAARSALADEYGRNPVLIGCGGSLGAVEGFKRILGIPTLLFSFGLDDDQVHAPNEKFEVKCFRHGSRTHARLLANLEVIARDWRRSHHELREIDNASKQ